MTRLKAADRKAPRLSFTFRMTPEGRDRLIDAASANGRSIAQEVEFRLEQSFKQQDADAAIERAVARAFARHAPDVEAAPLGSPPPAYAQ